MAKLEVVGTEIPEEEVKRIIVNSLNMRLIEVEKTLSKLQSRMAEFETRYGMSSKEFLEKYEKGLLGDDLDFFEWEACLTIRTRISREREALKEVLG